MHNLATRAARFMAICGGLVLALLILLICISVVGRSLNGVLHGWIGTAFPAVSAWLLQAGVGPINGDFELVEAGVAFSIFSFLPLCQISGGHASVDIFTSKLPRGVNRGLQMVIDTVFAFALIIMAYQLYKGMLSKLSYGDTTFLLQFPIWWAYAASLVGAVMAAVISVYVACVRVMELATGQDVITDETGMG
ncbi:MAG: TRAP transporter small permease [Rhodobacterales bacterium]|jgi:TRAP-type C4-dicarboxylate transport system permease small subunit|uniref:TRAP transporter small permease n=1 Tax=uncultured Planktomarina sp. TaxID=1538529 RepID=UPI0032608DFF|tara:strand:- start:560 stop:1138 length:579 start_codon:yes stop_codon:yes gene_type:complete